MRRSLVLLAAAAVLGLGAAGWFLFPASEAPRGVAGPERSGGAPRAPGEVALADPAKHADPARGETAPAPPRPAFLAGQVLEDGVGVGQARVELRLRGQGEGCEASGVLTTAGGGGFESGPLCAGQYDVVARRGGSTASRTIRLRAGEREETVLSLLAEGGLEVAVKHRDGGAVPGAKVEATLGAFGTLVSAIADAAGQSRFPGLMPGMWQLEVSAPATFGHSEAAQVRSGKIARVTVTLDDAAWARGELVDEAGAPVPGIPVALSARLSAEGRKLVRGRSGDGGSFELGPVVPGRYELTVDAFEPRRETVTLPSTPLRLVVARGAEVEVQLLEQGTPTTGFVALSGKTYSAAEGSSDAGAVRFTGVPRGDLHVLGGAADPAAGRVRISASSQLTVSARHHRVELEVGDREPGAIEGSCRATSGHRLPKDVSAIAVDAELAAASHLDRPNPPPELLARLAGSAAFGICQADGGILLEGLKTGRYRIQVRAREDRDKFETRLEASTGERIEVAVPGVAWFRFRVVDSEGNPVTRWGFRADDLRERPGGRYESEVYEDQDLSVSVHATGFVPVQRRASFKRGQDLDLGDVVLTRQGRVVRGRVFDAVSGEPIGAAELSLGDAELSMHKALSSADGTFELGPVPARDDAIEVTHGRYRAARVAFEAASNQPLEVPLQPAPWIRGGVLTRSGAVPAGLFVRATAPGREPSSADVVGGSYQLGPLEPGSWVVVLGRGEDVEPVPDTSVFDAVRVSLVEGQGAVVDFVERTGGHSFTVERVDSSGAPSPGGVWLVPGRPAVPAGKDQFHAMLAEARVVQGQPIAPGVLRFSAIPAGEYSLVGYGTRGAVQPLLVGPALSPQQRLVVP